MNDLSVDIGYKSINHYGEQLCGDHVEVVEQEDGDKVIVLADGLRSGVKASILSTLTAKIISTMMAADMSLEECVHTIAATLPISSEYGVAYSTFTIMHIKDNQTMELIQYENPNVILIRDFKVEEYDMIETVIDDKKIYRSEIDLHEDDIFVAMSDGCPGANSDLEYNKDWKESDIASFMETIAPVGYPAKTLATILIEECRKLYNGKPLDDATACVVRVMKRTQVNLLFGPPSNRDDCDRMMSLFFSKAGKKIVCGGTTAQIAADYLGTTVRSSTAYSAGGPPISEIDGVDLVTEGIVTMDKVLKNAKDYVGRDEGYVEWSVQHDAAALVSRILFEEATDINFFVGKAVNPAHQEADMPLNFSVKMNIVEELTVCLKKMGKKVKVSYF
jgi:hypothetical protein